MDDRMDDIYPCVCGEFPKVVYEDFPHDEVAFVAECKNCKIKMIGTYHSPYIPMDEKINYKKELINSWNEWRKKYK